MATITVTTRFDENDPGATAGAPGGTGLSLREAITLANADEGADTIVFDASLPVRRITLGSDLPAIDSDLTIDGGANGFTVSGEDQFRGFFVLSGNVRIQSLTIEDASAKGGAGGSASSATGGGGAGLGGALFVKDGAAVTLSDVTFLSNRAVGGDGGLFQPSAFGLGGYGGGGGMGGDGGHTSDPGMGGGGGIGTDADGGGATLTGGPDVISYGNGEGGIVSGAEGGGGGAGVGLSANGAGGSDGGGGGAGATGGGGGGIGGGLGTIVTIIFSGGIPVDVIVTPGGAGGFGGGSGANATFSGGFGGGGGALSDGGFGGGGGGAETESATGEGGFGGGGGTAVDIDSGLGGGGAGMGGGIFVMEGASLTILGGTSISGGSVAGGGGGEGAAAGQAFGAGLFLEGSGALAFNPGAGETQIVADRIEDEAGVVAGGYTPPGGFTPGSWGLVKSGAGILILGTANNFTGATTVNAGLLRVDGSIANSAATVKSGATLGGTGTTGAASIGKGGTLAPGASAGILRTGDLTLAAGAIFGIEIGGNAAGAGHDQVKVTGSVSLGGAALDGALIGGFAALFGESYTIIDNDGANSISGTFAGLAEGAVATIGKMRMGVTYQGGNGNDVALKVVGAVITGTAGGDLGDAAHTIAGEPLPTAGSDLIFGLAGEDSLSGLAGDDVIDGGEDDDRLRGDAGDDTLLGKSGSDRLSGDDGDDDLNGGGGRDVVRGGAGNDVLNGGPRTDKLTGDDGNDTFVFAHPRKPDKVTDFADGDAIALAKAAFTGIGPKGALAAGRFHIGDTAETQKQKILYDADTGWLLYAKKGSATIDPLKFVKIGKDLGHLGSDDFFVI